MSSLEFVNYIKTGLHSFGTKGTIYIEKYQNVIFKDFIKQLFGGYINMSTENMEKSSVLIEFKKRVKIGRDDYYSQ